MALRDYIFENLGWKLAALVLAVAAWLSIRFAGEWGAQRLNSLPVQVMTTPGDNRAFRVDPARVDVIVRATPSTLKNLSDQQVRVFVNLTDIPDVPGVGIIREVLAYSPNQIQVVRIEPKAVSIERIGGEKDTLTNSITKP